jgi:thiol:disulfide interchange protein DsbD
MRSKLLLGLLALLVAFPVSAGTVSELLNQSSLLLTLVSFFGMGILLAFTPCVLPMVPILSAVLIGREEMGTRKGVQLSLVFVISMALTYALAGIAAGYLGSTLQTLMQTPWVIVGFSFVFVAMALSMFGVFQLSVPSILQTHLHTLNNRLKQGSYLSVAIMGVLSTLIASPCVTAPLVSVLTYIAQSGNPLKGGAILFSLALGMGLPLLLFGFGQSALLPRTGNWMNGVKSLFGVMMLGLAIWLLSRILPEQMTIWLSASLLIISSVALGVLDLQAPRRLSGVLHGVAVLAFIYGIFLMIAAASGRDDIFNPLMSTLKQDESVLTVRPVSSLFQYVTTSAELQQKLVEAKQAKKPVMIEFFATWCSDCKHVDKEILSDPAVRKQLRQLTAVRVDVSERNPELYKMMETYHVLGVPTMIFYNSHGEQVTASQLGDTMTKENLQKVLASLS